MKKVNEQSIKEFAKKNIQGSTNVNMLVVQETEKAVKVRYLSQFTYKEAWIPKSACVIEEISEKEELAISCQWEKQINNYYNK